MPKQLATSYKNFVRCSVPSCILRLGVLNYAVVWLCLIFGGGAADFHQFVPFCGPRCEMCKNTPERRQKLHGGIDMNMRKILALLMAVVMICSMFVSPALAAGDEGIVAISETVAPQFSDLKDHWSESAIIRWAEAGIVKGDGDGTVHPERNLKRAELATVLARILGLKATSPAGTFSDVAANAWYADAVLKCHAAGIMLGVGGNRANPESPIDRQQAIVMVGRALGVKESSSSSLDRFADKADVADWAAPYMAALADMNILSGVPQGNTVVVAPNVDISRAATFVLLDKAIAQYITAPCTVTVNDPNKFVVINASAEEEGAVTVTGKTAGVVVAAGTTNPVTLDKLDVDTVKVDAPATVTVSRDSSVDDLDVNAAAKIDNKGTVTNLNTNADDVTFDGNKPSKVNTAEGVEPAKDSKGNEVTDKPANTGSSNTGNTGNTSYKYKVSIPSAVGGTVTADVTRTNTANTEVTLTVTPDAGAFPYVLKSLTVKNGENEATDITAQKTFTMTEEGTYTVTAEFVRPITDAELFIVKDEKSYERLESFGYHSDNKEYELTTLAEKPWLAMCAKKTEGYTGGSIVLTANGNAVSNWPYGDKVYSYSTVYVNVKDDVDNTDDVLGLSGSAYHFVAEVTFAGLSYTFECDYVKPHVDENTLHTVTFKTSTGTELVSYKAAQGETVTAPAVPTSTDEVYYTGNWVSGETKVAAGATYTFTGDAKAITFTAENVPVEVQATKVRVPGPEGNLETFDYEGAYTAAGLTLKDNVITVDGAALLKYAENREKFDHLRGVNGTTRNSRVVMGVEYTAPTVAGKEITQFATAPTLAGLAAAQPRQLSSYPKNQLISYTDVATYDEANGKVILLPDVKQDGSAVECEQPGVKLDGAPYTKWMDENGNVLAVTKVVLERKTNVPTYTVTFKAGDQTVETRKVAYNAAVGELPAVTAKTGYTGAWMAGDTEVTAETVITAHTEVVAEYTPIVYTVAISNAQEAQCWTVRGKMGDNDEIDTQTTQLTLTYTDKPGYSFDGWYYYAPKNTEDEFPYVDAANKGAKEITINAADLPKYAFNKEDVEGDNAFTEETTWPRIHFLALDHTESPTGTVLTAEEITEAFGEIAKGEDWYGYEAANMVFTWGENEWDETLRRDVALANAQLVAYKWPGFGVDAEHAHYYVVFSLALPESVKKAPAGDPVVVRVGKDTDAKAYNIPTSWMLPSEEDPEGGIILVMDLGTEVPEDHIDINIVYNWAGTGDGANGQWAEGTDTWTIRFKKDCFVAPTTDENA